MQHHLGVNGSGSLLAVPPAVLANLCACYVISSQNEMAEDLLRHVEEETSAAQVVLQLATYATFYAPRSSALYAKAALQTS